MPSADDAPPLPGPQEIELKFALPPGELRRLQRHPLVAGSRPSRHLIASTYFDTPELALRDRALSLRIRKNGRGYVQTVKADTPGAVAVERAEWQAPLHRAAPDLSQPELRDRLGDLDGGALQPVFVSRIRRSTRLLRPGPGTVIELSYDNGDIATPAGARLSVCEIELELKEGDCQALFDLARALNHSLPLRLETLSKAARGYALLLGTDIDAARRQNKIALRPEMPVSAALDAIVEHCLRHMLANDRATLAGDSEGVHQMRVALRRLKSALKLFKAMLPQEQRAHILSELKWVAATLGAARNWDVFADHLAEVAQAFAGNGDLEALTAAASERQRLAHGAVRETLSSSRYTDFALEMLSSVETGRWRREHATAPGPLLAAPISGLADTLLDRRYRKARKLGKKFAALDAKRRHEFRIALKELRYAMDSLADVYDGKTVKRQLKRLQALQDDLGLLNDVATMGQLLEELAPAGGSAPLRQGAALVTGWYGRVAAEREAKLGRRVARFLKAKPFWTRPEAA